MLRDEYSNTIRSTLSLLSRHPAFLGALIGILAACSQALLISAGGPEAYGFCVACHTRDMVNGITNIVAHTDLALAAISKNSLLPVLSVAGVLIGGYIASTFHREHKIRKGTQKEYLIYFIAGVLVLNLAMIFGGCPYRAALRTGYGDLTAVLFIVAMAAGVILGAYLMLKKAEKEAV